MIFNKVNIFLSTFKKVLDFLVPQAWIIAPHIAPKHKVKDIHVYIALSFVITFWSAIPGVVLHAIDFYTLPLFGLEVPNAWLEFSKQLPLYIFAILLFLIINYAEHINHKAEQEWKKKSKKST